MYFSSFSKAFNVFQNLIGIPLNLSHCERALKKCSSLNLRDVQLHSPGDRDFDDVGGLDDVKKMLVETLLWPAQVCL